MVYNVIQGSKRKHIFLGMEPCNDVVDVNSPELFLGEERAMPEDPSLIDAEPHAPKQNLFQFTHDGSMGRLYIYPYIHLRIEVHFYGKCS